MSAGEKQAYPAVGVFYAHHRSHHLPNGTPRQKVHFAFINKSIRNIMARSPKTDTAL